MDIENNKNIRDLLWMLVLAVLSAFIILCCSSCRTSKAIDTIDIQHDTITTKTKDSVYVSRQQQTIDTVWHDSQVYVILDSAGNEKSRIERYDTYRSRNNIIRDTVFKLNTDTVIKIKYINKMQTTTIVKEAAIPFLTQLFINIGKAATFVTIVIVILYMLSRFIKRDK